MENKNISALPTLNVLTILTIIGSIFQILSGIYNYFAICNSTDSLDQIGDIYADLGAGAMLSDLMESISDVAVVQCENRLLVFAVTIVSAGMCLGGALLMRKLKKSGLGIYLVGEFMLNIFTLLFFGATGLYLGILLSGLIVPIVFSILYLVQKKNLIY